MVKLTFPRSTSSELLNRDRGIRIPHRVPLYQRQYLQSEFNIRRHLIQEPSMELYRHDVDRRQLPLHLTAQGGTPMMHVDSDVTTDFDVSVE